MTPKKVQSHELENPIDVKISENINDSLRRVQKIFDAKQIESRDSVKSRVISDDRLERIVGSHIFKISLCVVCVCVWCVCSVNNTQKKIPLRPEQMLDNGRMAVELPPRKASKEGEGNMARGGFFGQNTLFGKNPRTWDKPRKRVA